ncbi:hypothetical protein [Haladaptatus sp. DYF46]|uniref:DUF7286 family protein n=1 Tax=Haladaptatus sp. DYF46 TaxID=2886041 RepID=UPI001E40C450|nr:hypothetical protein [Haladaptatus sp. DYF46]
MRLADDTRGRVPFALVGVLLLVGSVAFAGALVTRPTPNVNQNVDRSMRAVTAGTQTALRGAIRQAGRDAAAEPLIRTANTTAGRVINDSTPFRDYLRLRIYLSSRRRLRAVSAHVGDVRGTASLPMTPNATALRRAKRRVHVEPVGKPIDAGLRVRIENVSVRATRGGTTVAATTRDVTLVVETPVLALHERVQRFERRLDTGPLDSGLGRRLTARLYAVTWARGYAQYGGAPIANVLGNRHVELMTNGAILEEQTHVFGASDPAGRRGVRRATARVGLTDLLAPTTQRGMLWTDLVLNAADAGGSDGTVDGSLNATPESPDSPYTPETGMEVGVNESADRALLELIDGGQSSALDDAIASAYRVSAKPVASVHTVRDESEPTPDSPGDGWTLASERTSTRISVENATASSPGTQRGWHLLWSGARRVVRTHTVVRQWQRTEEGRKDSTARQSFPRLPAQPTRSKNRTVETTHEWTEEFVVSLGVAGDHVTTEYAPDRPVASAHESRGRSGPNLAGVRGKAVSRLITHRGGADALARRATVGTMDTRAVTVQGRYVPSLRQHVYRDVRRLRARVRNRSVTVSRGAVATAGTNPAAGLAATLRERRNALVNAPAGYESAGDRAKYAARAVYLDSVISRLERRAERTRRTQKGFGEAIRDATGISVGRIRRLVSSRSDVSSPSSHLLPTNGPGAPVNLSVDGSPSYLTLSAVTHRHVSAVRRGETAYPLSARNTNLFTIPSSDIADGVLSFLPDSRKPKQVSLRAAGFALRSANETLATAKNESLRRHRDELRKSISASIDDIEANLLDELATSDAIELDRTERRLAVHRGLADWRTTADRAIAISNGSAAERIAREIERKQRVHWNRMRRDTVTFRVRFALESARRDVGGVRQSNVKSVVSTTRGVLVAELKAAVQQEVENRVQRRLNESINETVGDLPAGLPVVPIPGYWYATVNVWQVDVSGTYARFTVRAREGSPTSPGASVAYSRESGSVRLDTDGDGTMETLGRTTPISFDTETTVVVAVPPGKTGVGDVDGNADERSSGWSNRSNNPFGAPGRRGDHALRRDRRPR